MLRSYPPGVRTIRIKSSGRDLQFWAGFYGPKIAGSSLKIQMESSPPPTQPFEHDGEEFQDEPSN